MSDPLRACVIDDEAIVCERLRPVLEKSGFVVDTFTSSEAALRRLSEQRFDVLITDIKMAGPDGLELLRYTKTHAPETRVIVITGYATAETARDALKSGAVDFIAKPFRLSDLRKLVQRLADELRGEPAE